MMLRSTAAAVVVRRRPGRRSGVAVVSSQSGKASANKPSVAVFKSPTCGCCAKWNEHMTAAGYAVTRAT